MLKYCIAMIDIIARKPLICCNAEVFYLGKREDGMQGWFSSIEHKGIIWYDTAREAKARLIELNECVVAWNVPVEAEKERWLNDENYKMPKYEYPLPGMGSAMPSAIEAIKKSDPKPVMSTPEMPKPEEKKAESQKLEIPLPGCGEGSKYDLWLKKFVKSGKEIAVIKDGKQFGNVTLSAIIRGLQRYATKGNYPVECVYRSDACYVKKIDKKQMLQQPQKKDRTFTRQVTTRVTESFT